MRTNLTGSVVAVVRHGTGRGQPSKAFVRFVLPVLTSTIVALSGSAVGANDAARSLLASSISATPQDCYTADQIKAVLFPRQQIVAYDFTGVDAARLKDVMDVVATEVAPSAALVRVVLVPATNEAMAFQFGVDGCHTVTLDLDWSQMSRVFQSAGVAAPFGATFYQSPGIAI
jgi:hypothetical protein